MSLSLYDFTEFCSVRDHLHIQSGEIISVSQGIKSLIEDILRFGRSRDSHFWPVVPTIGDISASHIYFKEMNSYSLLVKAAGW